MLGYCMAVAGFDIGSGLVMAWLLVIVVCVLFGYCVAIVWF